jgi:arginine N-succinyltransferase
MKLLGILLAMIRLRLVEDKDIDGVYDLSSFAPVGLTTLPHDHDMIKDKVEKSVKYSSSISDFPDGSSFLFVLEEDSEIIGTSAVFTKTGGMHPHWTYKLNDFNYFSKSFEKNIQSKYLKLKAVHNGPSELGTLFLRKDKRVGNNGKLLSLGRFLFIAQHISSFESTIIAELRGTIIDGESPFWNDIGRNFMNCSLQEADSQVLIDKSFIGEMMPRFPIYVNMLSKEAQDVIGKADSKTVPAKILLEKENFKVIDEVDIFEAGPILSSAISNIKTIQSKKYKYAKLSKKKKAGGYYLISNCSGGFKACISKADVRSESVDKVLISSIKGK